MNFEDEMEKVLEDFNRQHRDKNFSSPHLSINTIIRGNSTEIESIEFLSFTLLVESRFKSYFDHSVDLFSEIYDCEEMNTPSRILESLKEKLR